jgi:hypothetical protein
MLNTTHQMSGAAACAWLAVAVRPTVGAALAGTVIGYGTAAYPDWDHLDAKPVRRFEIGRWRCKGFKLFGFLPIIPKFTWRFGIGPTISWLLRAVSHAVTGRKHRGLTHGVFFAGLVGCVFLLLAVQWMSVGTALYLAAAAGLGVVAALAGDQVTRGGLRFTLWPLKYQISVPQWLRITTGGTAEKAIFVVTVLAAGVGLWLVLSGMTVLEFVRILVEALDALV